MIQINQIKGYDNYCEKYCFYDEKIILKKDCQLDLSKYLDKYYENVTIIFKTSKILI